MNLKKKLMVLLAAGILAFSAMPLALAATPRPADNTEQAEQAQTEAVNTAAGAPVQTDTADFTNKKYLTKGGAAFWFIFTILLNGALSFWIGNRFYRLSRKDNHVTAEIRALRRDIEDKLVKSVGGFSEQELDIENLNESLALDDEGIKPVERKQNITREVNEEEEERFRKWEAAQSKPKTEHARPKSVVREELNEEFDDVKRIRRKNYQPHREVEELPPEDEAEDLGETKVMKPVSEVKSKAKEILGDIFPFKED